MGAPCINDTCSIKSQVDPVTRRLQIDAHINEDYGLACVDPNGIQLKILGNPDPVNPNDTGFQQLGIDLSGNAFAIPKRARVHSFSGSTVNIPQGGSEGDFYTSSPITVGANFTNPYSAQATVLIIGQYKIGFTVQNNSSGLNGNIDGWIPYHADIEALMEVNNTDANSSKAWFDIGGILPSCMNQTNKRIWENFAFYTTIEANATMSISAKARHTEPPSEGCSEGGVYKKSVNISTVPGDAGNFPDRGFKAEGVAIIFPFTAQVLT